MNMLHSLRIATVAAAMLVAAASSLHAQTATVDDTAKFLAGMMPSADSPLVPLTKEAAWQRHAKFLDSAFGQLEQRQLSRIRAWADTNLAAPKPTMFYMFSGPDFLYANAFYSKASTYVLSALEPVGSVPDLSRLPRGGIASALYNVERSLGSILSFSFFITKQMKTDLQAGQISGTLPILYVFLARSGVTVKSVSPISLDDQGAAYFAGENAGSNAVRGVRITHPELPRPYRAWGYPVTPVVFQLVTAFMMYYLLTERPVQSLLGLLIMFSGLLIYAVFRKRPDQAPVAVSSGHE